MLVTWGLICSVISGAAAPFIAVVLGEIVEIFDPSNDVETIQDGIVSLFKVIAIISSVQWIFGYFQYACLQAAAERLSFDLRTLYLKSLLRQEPEFFERQ